MKTSFFIALFSIVAGASPSLRPLPNEIIDGTKDFHVIRDHEQKRLFHLIPKRYQVVENEMASFGDQSEGCQTVVEYNKTVKVLAEAKRVHATISYKRAELSLGLLEQFEKLGKQIGDLLVEKLRLEKEIAAGADTLPPPELEKRKQRLAEVSVNLVQFETNLTRLQNVQKATQTEQTEVLAQITLLEAEIDKFAISVTRPAAKITIRLQLPQASLEDEVFRRNLGITKTDSLSLPKLAGLSLYPFTNEDVSIIERSKKDATIGGFLPEWNIAPLELQSSRFGESTYDATGDSREIPQLISYEQIISLYTYCSLNNGRDTKNNLYVPLRVGFEIPFFVDKKNASTGPDEWLRYRTAIDITQWKRLVFAPAPLKEVKPESVEDRGAPSQFSGEGTYEAKPYSVRFDFSQLQNLNRERK